MIYEIEILTSNKKIINAYKKDQMGVEYACADDLPNLEAAINVIRKKWKHEGNIFLVQDGIRKVLGE
jgi:N-acetylmuramic acid 6-phosphate (MurNAc-6-P) etherase